MPNPLKVMLGALAMTVSMPTASSYFDPDPAEMPMRSRRPDRHPHNRRSFKRNAKQPRRNGRN